MLVICEIPLDATIEAMKHISLGTGCEVEKSKYGFKITAESAEALFWFATNLHNRLLQYKQSKG